MADIPEIFLSGIMPDKNKNILVALIEDKNRESFFLLNSPEMH